ncbi:MAG: phosphate/phosphite/phosphonate ABC transporter substrate-binding protein [Proteobacteria bacterium]|nr:phosphate/phosphite/phosphonate ABC transporter substrate-binding protein [Pseudomonadota bacterium]MBU1738444.1 phosphate/phosphite/phosphonate ABC transporter substrate-binding protein [Pseudomonadota bacterium]
MFKKTVGFLAALFIFLGCIAASAASAETLTCWFPPGWKSKAPQAKAITDALSEKSGLTIRPIIAQNYPQILDAFTREEMNIVYVGSFVQAIINARGIGTALVQNMDGKELYSGVLVYPKGGDPEAILKNSPAEIAFAKGASSGESSAKAATNGLASIPTANHGATCGAVKAGKAKAGVVKNWWWNGNKDKFPELDMYRMPGISIEGNPDNVLTVSKAVPAVLAARIKDAAIAAKDAFGSPNMAAFDTSHLKFSLDLMAKGKIDPLNYSW